MRVGQGILIGRRILLMASEITSVPPEVLISADQGGLDRPPSSTFRFYGRRPNEPPWRSEDLEHYSEAVLVIRLQEGRSLLR